MKLHNFNSGPSILPPVVMQKAAEAIMDFEGSGLSILEIGHRTSLFQDVMQEAVQSVKTLMQIGDDYEVFSNWRRTKYPVFNYANWTNTAGQKVSYPGNVTAGKMWRRFSLPIAERNVNADNYNEAIKRQNYTEQELDLLQGRMWWDVGPGTGQSN